MQCPRDRFPGQSTTAWFPDGIVQTLRVAGGREVNLRSMQAMALYPANSMFVSDYLTTPGQKAEEDFRMIADLGFRITAGDYESAKLLELWKVPHAVSCGAASAGSCGSGGCG